MGSIPGWWAKILQATQPTQSKQKVWALSTQSTFKLQLYSWWTLEPGAKHWTTFYFWYVKWQQELYVLYRALQRWNEVTGIKCLEPTKPGIPWAVNLVPETRILEENTGGVGALWIQIKHVEFETSKEAEKEAWARDVYLILDPSQHDNWSHENGQGCPKTVGKLRTDKRYGKPKGCQHLSCQFWEERLRKKAEKSSQKSQKGACSGSLWGENKDCKNSRSWMESYWCDFSSPLIILSSQGPCDMAARSLSELTCKRANIGIHVWSSDPEATGTHLGDWKWPSPISDLFHHVTN